MPRRREVPKRAVQPDPVYNSEVVTKFINCMMTRGKKTTAEGIFYDAMEIIAKKMKDEPLKVFKRALQNAKPLMEVKSRRVGGSNYQVPVEVRSERQQSLAIRWLIGYSRGRGEKTMAERLAAEFMDAFNERGATIKKREDTHKMAEANKAFAHFRW
ncbi:MAG: 30S ribosomal protein S7 [Acidobacteria bacterium]|nr:30S ribosomal protein S7 [Acidobacteriota bacterium]